MTSRFNELRHGGLEETMSLVDGNRLEEIEVRAVLLNLLERWNRTDSFANELNRVLGVHADKIEALENRLKVPKIGDLMQVHRKSFFNPVHDEMIEEFRQWKKDHGIEFKGDAEELGFEFSRCLGDPHSLGIGDVSPSDGVRWCADFVLRWSRVGLDEPIAPQVHYYYVNGEIKGPSFQQPFVVEDLHADMIEILVDEFNAAYEEGRKSR